MTESVTRRRTRSSSAARGAPKAAAAAAASSEAASPKATVDAKSFEYEFGGPLGSAGILVASHVLLYVVYYLLYLLPASDAGKLIFPTTVEGLKTAVVEQLWPAVAPTKTAAAIYFAFVSSQALFARFMPGLLVTGRAPHKLKYLCNGYSCWWATLLLTGAAHALHVLKVTGKFDTAPYLGGVSLGWNLATVIENAGPIMTVGIIFADIQSIFWYVYAHVTKQVCSPSPNAFYDFFMGIILHPRIGSVVDIKMFAEVRLSWFMLFMLTASAAAKQFELTGYSHISASMGFMMLAHWLYANACAKGEHYIPPTWDIAVERYGWMLCFWNFAGVPFLYCAQSVYILKRTEATLGAGAATAFEPLPQWALVLLFQTLLFAYYIWDTSQSQKNHFRYESEGTVIERNTFPKLPWGIINNAKHLKTKAGSPLLIDGWWAYARKIHYTCDIVMGLTWGLCCGFDAPLPYLYFFFFLTMILHRYGRDNHRCAKKYGKDWETYTATVPYTFVPGLI